MCLAQGPQRSDEGEARTRGPSVSSQAKKKVNISLKFDHGFCQMNVNQDGH